MASGSKERSRPDSVAGRIEPGRVGVGAAVVLAALLAGSCGGESADSPPRTTPADRDAVEVVLDDYRFIPATLSPGSVEIVRAQNLGGVEHSWSVLESPIETEQELAGATVLAEARAGVGQSATADISGLAPGRYQVVCVIPGHVSAGMVGELIVDG